MNLKFDTSSLTSAAGKLSYGDQVRPQRDWLIVILVAGILLIASAGWSYWIFQETSWNESSRSMSAQATVNTSVFDTVRTIFEKRAAEQAHYLNDYRFVDPSQQGS